MMQNHHEKRKQLFKAILHILLLILFGRYYVIMLIVIICSIIYAIFLSLQPPVTYHSDGIFSNFGAEKNLYSLEKYQPKTPITELNTPLEVNTTPNKIAITPTSLSVINEKNQFYYWGICSNRTPLCSYRYQQGRQNINHVIGIESDEHENLLMLREDGRVWAIGSNTYGQINPKHYESYNTQQTYFKFIEQEELRPIDGLNDIVDIALVEHQSFFLNKYGDILFLGPNRSVVDSSCLSSYYYDTKKSVTQPTALYGLENIRHLELVNIIPAHPLLAISKTGKLYRINEPIATKDGTPIPKDKHLPQDCQLSFVYDIQPIPLNKKVVDASRNRDGFKYQYTILLEDGSLVFYGTDSQNKQIIMSYAHEIIKNFPKILKLGENIAYTVHHEMITWDKYSSHCENKCEIKSIEFNTPYLLTEHMSIQNFKSSSDYRYHNNLSVLIDQQGQLWIWGDDKRHWFDSKIKKKTLPQNKSSKKTLITLRNTGVNINS